MVYFIFNCKIFCKTASNSLDTGNKFDWFLEYCWLTLLSFCTCDPVFLTEIYIFQSTGYVIVTWECSAGISSRFGKLCAAQRVLQCALLSELPRCRSRWLDSLSAVFNYWGECGAIMWRWAQENRAPYHYLHTNARREVVIRKYRSATAAALFLRTQHLRHSQQAPVRSRGNNTTYSHRRRVFTRQLLKALPLCFNESVTLLIKFASRILHCSI